MRLEVGDVFVTQAGRFYVCYEVRGTEEHPVYEMKETATGKEVTWTQLVVDNLSRRDTAFIEYPRSAKRTVERVIEKSKELVHGISFYTRWFFGRL